MTDQASGGPVGAEDFFAGLSRALGMGGDPRAVNEQFERMQAADREMARCIARVFATEDGARVLAWLKANTWEKEEVAADLLLTHPPQQVMAHAIFRRGENSVVDLIEDAIADGEQRPRRRRRTA